MKKKSYFLPAVLLFVLLLMSTAWAAASYSSAWYQSGSNWCVMGPGNKQLTNAWFCDDAVPANGKNVWYLIDENGHMVSSPLVKDGTGNYYSLETRHNGLYGSLRYQSGLYDGVYLSFSQSHNGTFGAITNPDGIRALEEKYGCVDVSHINNNNCYYSSSWIATSNVTSWTISYYTAGSKYATKTSDSDTLTIISCGDKGFKCWEEASTGDQYYPGDEYVFGSSQANTTRMNAIYQSQKETRSLNYFIDNNIYRSVVEQGNTSTVIAFPKDRLSGREFLYWRDDEGNCWEPGEVYTFCSNIDFMHAVFAGEE